MIEHCDHLPDEFRGRPVSLIPPLRETLVLRSADQIASINTFQCSVCHQAWEEEYTTTRRATTVRVRKVSRVERITVPDAARVSEAILVWTGAEGPGKGRTPYPVQDDELLVERFDDAALDLLPLVKKLADEFFASDACHVAGDLKEMGDLAAQRFRARYPELTEEAVEALARCYTWMHK